MFSSNKMQIRQLNLKFVFTVQFLEEKKCYKIFGTALRGPLCDVTSKISALNDNKTLCYAITGQKWEREEI